MSRIMQVMCQYRGNPKWGVVLVLQNTYFLRVCVCAHRWMYWNFKSVFFDLFPFDRNAYENCVVLEARICYDVAKLMYLNSER